jgi:hypothetical protein
MSEECGGAREATDDIMRRIRLACWVSKAIRAHTHRRASASTHGYVRTHARTHINI